MASVPYLKKYYLEKVVPELIKSRGYKNIHQVPNLQKIVLNSAFKAEADKGHMAEVVKDITKLSGQKPVLTKASKSVAAFKVREGMTLGCMVTLRGARMWEFYLRLTAVALPMIRDFRGVSPRSFDGQGNYTIGITDFTAIPISGFKGDNITASPSANTPWYDGPALIAHLEDIDVDNAAAQTAPFRMPVQWVNRPNLDFRGFAGLIASGTVRVGDAVRIVPSGSRR